MARAVKRHLLHFGKQPTRNTAAGTPWVASTCKVHGGVCGGPIATSKLFNPDGSLTVVGEACRAEG